MPETPARIAPSSLIRSVWVALPKRGYDALVAKLAEQDYQAPSRSAFFRQKAKWPEQERTAWTAQRPEIGLIAAAAKSAASGESFKPLPVVVPGQGQQQAPPAAPFDTTALRDIPDALIEALGLRMIPTARVDGLDKFEDELLRAVKAIVDRGDENCSRDLATLAGAHRDIMSARSLVSMQFRNFADGDRLSGEAARFNAEAENIRNAGRADNAKEINGSSGGPSYESGDVEDEAIAAMREVEGRQ